MKGEFHFSLPKSFFPPLFRNISMENTFNQNSNASQLSYHIDNWISIYSGLSAIKFLSRYQETSFTYKYENGPNQFHFEHSQDPHKNEERLTRVYNVNLALEQDIKTYSLHKNKGMAIENHF